MELAAQIISIFAMIFNISSYQQKRKSRVIALQLFGAFLFSVSFFMLGAYIGAILNALAVVRAIIFLNEKRLHTEHILWFIGFCALYLVSYVMTFTVFEKPVTPFNLIIEALPVIGMVATTVSYRMKEAKAVRRLGLVTSPSWLIYNIVSMSVGAILCESFSLISIVVGMLRLDRKKKNKNASLRHTVIFLRNAQSVFTVSY